MEVIRKDSGAPNKEEVQTGTGVGTVPALYDENRRRLLPVYRERHNKREPPVIFLVRRR